MGQSSLVQPPEQENPPSINPAMDPFDQPTVTGRPPTVMGIPAGCGVGL